MTSPPDWPFVVVHGPPGAGKSRLTRDLARITGLAYFDRDEIKDAIFDSVGYSDRGWSRQIGAASWEVLALLAERFLRAGVSFIIESNFGPSRVVESLRAASAEVGLVVASVHVTAAHEVLWDRFDRRRAEGGRHPGHAGFTDRTEFLEGLSRRDFGPLDFGGPQLQIDTTTDWPDVEAVRRWLEGLPSGRAGLAQVPDSM